MDATDDPALDTLESRFARFADEVRGRSPLYERLAGLLARDASPAAALLGAGRGQRRPTLWLAALHELLLADPDEPLAAWYPSCSGDRAPDAPGLWEALVDTAERHREELATTVATRNTQTNEIGRSAGLRLALSEVRRATGAPIALVELGTAAGLLLLVDRVAHRYGDRRPAGPTDPALTLDVRLRGDGRPPGVADDLEIVDRVGLDVDPMDPADPATASWLRACVWPEHTHRLARLDAALAIAADLAADPATAIAPRQVVADAATDDLERVVRARPRGTAVVLWSSSALAYLPRDERDRLPARLTALGRERELWQAAAEGPFLPPFDRLDATVAPEGDNPFWNAVTLTRWSGASPEHRLLARMGPHGDWLRWLDLRT